MKYILALIPSVLYSICYSIGGRDSCNYFIQASGIPPRFWRRVIAPLALTVPIIAYLLYSKFDWIVLLSPVSYMAAMALTKYGGETLWAKIRGRIWSGLVVGLAGSLIALSAHSYGLLVAQVILSVLAHLAFGIHNIMEAPYEEALISFLTVVLVPWMIL